MALYKSKQMELYVQDPVNVIPPRKTWDILNTETIMLLPYLDHFEDYVESTGGRIKNGIEITDNRAFPIIKQLNLKIFKAKNGSWYLFLGNV